MRGVAIIASALVAVAVQRAEAFPELTIRGEVARCTMCHVSPGGGGILNEYGRNEAGDLLSRGGDGGFLHGAWTPPSWLLLGGDLRAAALAYDDTQATEGLQLAAFPMQADLRAAVQAGPFAVVVTGGLRGSTRLYSKSAANYVQSSEHYAMWTASSGAYVRAGKFFPVQGLRLPDHTLYVARYTGLDLFEQPYGADAGYVGDAWEVHAAGFVHDPIVDVGRRESGGVFYAELHREAWAVGVQGRFGTGEEGTRALGGMTGWVRGPGKLVLLGELDVINDQIANASAVKRGVGLLGVDQKLANGVALFGWYEQYQEELSLRSALHQGAGLALKIYPRAHWELIIEGELQHVGPRGNVGLAMFQAHYYL
ncbi:MAG TPA: hypothetical protein VHN14_06115 [Kofleriaceae bacterium]|jgi:hypothetical protein|nr:hypothetical protein [Kofleriaceae bacterium]